MRGTLVEDTADQAHHRHMIDEVFGEQLLAGIGLEVRKAWRAIFD
jgi:hypothetical protein